MIRKSFSEELPKKVDQSKALGADGENTNPSEPDNDKPLPIVHSVWFMTNDIGSMKSTTEAAPDFDKEIGWLQTVIRLPVSRSDHPSFKLETTAYVHFKLPRFGPRDWNLPAELFANVADGRSGKIKEDDRANVAKWRSGEIKEDGSLDTLPLLKAKSEFVSQRKALQRHLKQFRKEADGLSQTANADIKKMYEYLLKIQPQDEVKKTLEAELEKKRDILVKLNAYLEEARKLEGTYAPPQPSKKNVSTPFTVAEDAVDKLQIQLNDVALELSLGVQLDAGYPIKLIFIEASMQRSNRNDGR